MSEGRAAPAFGAEIPGRSMVFHVTQEQICWFLEQLEKRGCTADTVKGYRRNLRRFSSDLPEDKLLDQFTVSRWRDAMLVEGYLPSTVNQRLSAVNSFLEQLGLRGFQPAQQLELPEIPQPEITRGEYLRLLAAAKHQKKVRVYLLVKVFGLLGLTIQALPSVTVERVKQGRLSVSVGKDTLQPVSIPKCLQQELLEYSVKEGISEGPLFRNGKGGCLNRSFVTKSIQSLAEDAKVEPEKCTPRCLRKMCLATKEELEVHLSRLLEQTYERLLETEQLTTGWEENQLSLQRPRP